MTGRSEIDGLNRDRVDLQRVTKLLRKVASNSRRRPAAREALLDLAHYAQLQINDIERALDRRDVHLRVQHLDEADFARIIEIYKHRRFFS